MIVTVFKADEEDKKEEKKDTKEEVKKTVEDELAKKKAAIAAKLAKLEENDEDDEPELTPVVHDALEETKDDGFQVEEGKLMRETLIVFRGNQFLLYDFTERKGWQVGDVESQH